VIKVTELEPIEIKFRMLNSLAAVIARSEADADSLRDAVDLLFYKMNEVYEELVRMVEAETKPIQKAAGAYAQEQERETIPILVI
jgi:uncharacterized coiled-coil protein SlyX